MPFSPLEILSSISVFLLCFLAFILLSRGFKDTSPLFLGFFLLFNGLNYLGGLLFISELAYTYPSLVFWTNALPLTFGPLLWFYTRSIIHGQNKMTVKNWLHFLPFAILFLLVFISYQVQSEETKQEILRLAREDQRNSLPVILFTMAIYLHVLVYISLSVKAILKYRTLLKEQYSSPGEVSVNWWIRLLFLYALMLLVALVNSMFGFAENRFLYELSLLALSFATLLFASFMTYRAIVFPFQVIGQPGRQKYSSSALDQQKLDHLESSLNSLMENEQLYCEPQLSIDMLASRMELPPRSVSQLINQRKGMNFFDYINRLRINEVCRQLSNTDRTVLEIMYDTGFNSKSSFHTAFRKIMQMTPTEYRKKMSSTS